MILPNSLTQAPLQYENCYNLNINAIVLNLAQINPLWHPLVKVIINPYSGFYKESPESVKKQFLSALNAVVNPAIGLDASYDMDLLKAVQTESARLLDGPFPEELKNEHDDLKKTLSEIKAMADDSIKNYEIQEQLNQRRRRV